MTERKCCGAFHNGWQCIRDRYHEDECRDVNGRAWLNIKKILTETPPSTKVMP